MESRTRGGRPRYSATYNNSNSNQRGGGYSRAGGDVNNGRPRNIGRGGRGGGERGGFNNNRFQQREVHFDNSSKNRFPQGSRGKPRGTFVKGRYTRTRDEQHDSWYIIEIPHGETGGKDFLIRSLNGSLEAPLNPFNYHVEGNLVVFYIEGQDLAESLKSLNKRITKPDGHKIIINVKPSAPPSSNIDSTTTDLIKQVMSRRFSSDLNHLDLSKFRKDEEFVTRELYISLDRLSVMQAVVKIIQENIPSLAILDLSDNRIKFLKGLSTLKDVCPGIRALNLAKNNINNLSELEHLKGLNLEELSISENQVSKAVKDSSSLASTLRGIFPQLKKLDGQDLPASIGFDVGSQVTTTPATRGSSVPPEVAPLLESFLQNYYAIFDSNDRKSLMPLYHDQAFFSYSCFNSNHIPKDFIHEGRNLLRVSDPENKRKLLKCGNLNVVAALSSFPATNHIKESFILDVPLVTNEMVSLVITGLYLEPSQRQRTIRTFTRTLNLVPDGSGGCKIINDIWVIGNSSYDQRQKARDLMKNLSGASMQDDTMASETFNTADNSNPLSSEDEMVRKLSSITGMNETFSRQCLSEVNFNYDKAYETFLQVNALGAIPSAAFS